MKKLNISRLIVSIIIPQLVGLIGSYFTSKPITGWYETLSKPSFTPPNAVFGPVWIFLYLLMGISLYLIWNKGLENNNVRSAVNAFTIQLFLNLLWSIAFFGLQSPILGFIVIFILWLAIIYTIRKFCPISPLAAWLRVPYLLGVTFATILNLFIVIMNWLYRAEFSGNIFINNLSCF